MDGREGMALSGSAAASYYFNNRGGLSGSGGLVAGPAGGGSGVGAPPGGAPVPPGFKTHSNQNVTLQSSNIIGTGGGVSSAFPVENPSHSFAHGVSVAVDLPVTPGDAVKKKRGRPRKYAPDEANMSLVLSPLSATPSSGALTSSEPKRGRGRPPGSGWKQQLAPLGEWMNASAGLAFTPHVINIAIGEDVATKILSFAQHRPRALCILSASGSVSALTLRQPVTSGGTVTYEGRFEILCLSGSYLLAETGGPRNRTGGISISVCSPDGHLIGGAIGGRLIAASPVQVVACSFVYGGKTKNKPEVSIEGEKDSAEPAEKSISAPSQHQTSNSAMGVWPQGSQPNSKSSQTEIDLTRG